MTEKCPICQQPLLEYCRIADNEIVIYCSDVHRHSLTKAKHPYLEGTGPTTQLAHKKLVERASTMCRLS